MQLFILLRVSYVSELSHIFLDKFYSFNADYDASYDYCLVGYVHCRFLYAVTVQRGEASADYGGNDCNAGAVSANGDIRHNMSQSAVHIQPLLPDTRMLP